MLRSKVPVGDYGSSRLVRASIESDDVEPSLQTRAWRSLSRRSALPDSEQSRIYHDWIHAGKPHNFVCSECRLPENLIGCGRCCRAYHTQCLSAANVVPGLFHCPSCKEQAWDQTPPSSSTMMDSQEAPPESSFQRTEPPSRESASVQGSPLTGYETPGFATTNCSISKEDSYDTEHPDGLPPVFEMYSQVLAHLYQPDANRIHAVHQVEYLSQLNLMVREVESHRSLLEKMANLREEFSRVQTENMHLRAYLNSRMPSEGGFARPFIYPGFPRPLADTTGKSWDSIATDFI